MSGLFALAWRRSTMSGIKRNLYHEALDALWSPCKGICTQSYYGWASRKGKEERERENEIEREIRTWVSIDPLQVETVTEESAVPTP